MPRYRYKVIIEAEQWFPGKKVRGVTGDHIPDAKGQMWQCGCVILGSEGGHEPHVHFRAGCLDSNPVTPGDYVLTHPDGDRTVMGKTWFEEVFEEAK